MVFSDATLRDMCEKKPVSIEEFLGVVGVGEAKAERYGKKFICAVKDFLSES
jgi:ATP-dependent DNA helicase RecQ